MFKSTRRVLIGTVALIGIAVSTGTALTASNSVPETNAGQDADVVSGFTVSNIEYNTAPSNESNPLVTEVEFDIVRDANGGAARAVVADGNAEVYVQLRAASGQSNYADWAVCTTTAGHATCDMTADAGSQLTVEAVVGISVLAYDTISNDIVP